jgi:hypothetical protein
MGHDLARRLKRSEYQMRRYSLRADRQRESAFWAGFSDADLEMLCDQVVDEDLDTLTEDQRAVCEKWQHRPHLNASDDPAEKAEPLGRMLWDLTLGLIVPAEFKDFNRVFSWLWSGEPCNGADTGAD